MEYDVPLIKPEPGLSVDEAVGVETSLTTGEVKTGITFSQLPKARTNAEGGCQYTSFENVYVKMKKDLTITNLTVVKFEPRSPAESGEEEEGSKTFVTDIDILLPDIKQECSENSRMANQHAGFSRQQNSVLINPTVPRINSRRKTDFEIIYTQKKKKLKSTFTGVKTFSCSQCTYISNDKYNLTRHIVSHNIEKPFSCSTCTYASKRKCDLRSHERIHSGKKPYSCSRCSLTYNHKSSLMTHMFTHTGEKPFSCSQCTYSSNQKGNLIIHLRTHTGEKRFSCSQCTYSSKLKGTLTSHLLTHTGDKPFSCTQCIYKCNRKGSLKRHLLTHYGRKKI